MDRYWEGQHGAVFDGADETPVVRQLDEWAGWTVDDMIRYVITDRTPGE